MDLHNFHRIDLNLLVAFDALMAERSVVRAAERMFVGQPAMSHALRRLRDMLGDPLFVRTGNAMEPTAFAIALAPRVRAWLGDANGFLFDPATFDPGQAAATVRIGMPDGIEAVLLPGLVSILRRDAPGVVLHAMPVAADRVMTALDAGEIDLAIAPSTEAPREWHAQVALVTSRFECLYSRRLVKLPKRITLASLAEVDHVAYSYRGDVGGLIDGVFARNGFKRRIALVSASLAAVGPIVARAPLVSIQPSINAPIYADLLRANADLVAAPVAEPGMELVFRMSWHRRDERNALHAYLRGLVVDRFEHA